MNTDSTNPSNTAPLPVFIIKPYKVKSGDSKFRRRIRIERGCCDNCGIVGWENTQAHHILMAKMYPQYAREVLNILTLCEGCHRSVSNYEQDASPLRFAFYAELPQAVRSRHLAFLKTAEPKANSLHHAFEKGDSGFWVQVATR